MGMNNRKFLKKLLASPTNVRFDDFSKLVEGFGFELVRITGSHHIFFHPALRLSVNIQEHRGEAKTYQVRDFLSLVQAHRLTL